MPHKTVDPLPLPGAFGRPVLVTVALHLSTAQRPFSTDMKMREATHEPPTKPPGSGLASSSADVIHMVRLSNKLALLY